MILQKMLIRLTCIAPFTHEFPVRDEVSGAERERYSIDLGSVSL